MAIQVRKLRIKVHTFSYWKELRNTLSQARKKWFGFRFECQNKLYDIHYFKTKQLVTLSL